MGLGSYGLYVPRQLNDLMMHLTGHSRKKGYI